MKTAAQAIVFGDTFGSRLEENLDTLKKAGFEAVEAGPLLFEYGSLESIAKCLVEKGITLAAYHTGTRSIEDAGWLNELCHNLKELGCKHLICSGVLFGGATQDYYERTGRLLRERTPTVNSIGIELHYHHHDWEIRRSFGPQLGLHVIFDNAHEETKLVIDTYWAQAARSYVRNLFAIFKPRIKIVHLKDGSPEELLFAPLGKGKCRVSSHLDFLSKQSLEWIVWEQDLTHHRTIRECVGVSGRWLRERLK